MLQFGRFVKRYKRFFVDVEYEGKIITCHNPNTGSMRNLLIEGAPVCFSTSVNQKRTLPYTLEGIFVDNQWIQTNTIKANKLINDAIINGILNDFGQIIDLKREYKICDKRIDFYLKTKDKQILLEVKSVSLFDDEYAMFPDAKTKRGLEHLLTLKESIKLGFSPYILYLIQSSREKFRCAKEYDDEYCKLYSEVVPQFITPLFYRNIFDPYSDTNRIEKVLVKQ